VLTKNLLRFSARKNTVVPEFIDLKNEELQSLATSMIEIFQNSLGKSRAEISEETLLVLSEQSSEGSIGRGLEKLLFDRLEFAEGGLSTPEARNAIFSFGSKLLASGKFTDSLDYQSQIALQFEVTSEKICDQLYDDLPIYQKVSSFKSVSADKLMHRYNCAQVQGHLLNCQSLKIVVPSNPVADLRRLLKYVRFFNLVARVQSQDKGMCEIVIDGPLSLFFQTQKYGMGLANFFPALLHMKKWKLEAEIRMTPDAVKMIEVENTCGIRSHYDHFGSYVPEEIKMFQDQFAKKGRDWTISPGEEFLPLEGDSYCLPDFCFQKVTGEKVFLEVFHAWHGNPLISRLTQLEKPSRIPMQPLILAAAKSLTKDEKLKQAIADSNYFKNFGTLFREMPMVDQILGLLYSITT
jgi:uncharacterized protein